MRHLKLLMHVVEVAQTGSIRRAAEHVNLTPSAMNRRIQDLETEVGTPLFERRPRGVKLTAAGEMFVRYAHSQIADAKRLKSQVADLRGQRQAPVQIACSHVLAHDFLASRIATFQKQHPKVVFDLKVVEHERALAALAAHDVDLALVYGSAVSSSLRIIASLPQRLVAIVRSDHPLAAKRMVRLSECAAYPAALPDQTLSSRQILDAATARLNLSFDARAESNSFEMLRGLVFRCNMVSFQIEIDAPSSDLGMALVGRPIDTRDVPAADLALYQLRSRDLPAAAVTFAEALTKSMDNFKPI